VTKTALKFALPLSDEVRPSDHDCAVSTDCPSRKFDLRGLWGEGIGESLMFGKRECSLDELLG
jgi:hypothetical protein